MDEALEWVMWVLLGLASIFIAILLIGIGYSVYEYAASEKIVLARKDWKCTETKSSQSPVLMGKIIMTTTNTICINYQRQ